MNRKAYSSDLTDAEWALLAPFIPPALPRGRPRSTEMREVLDAIFYILRCGCAWRLLPHEFPKRQTVYHYLRAWRQTGLWEHIHGALRQRVRLRAGREAAPSRVPASSTLSRLRRPSSAGLTVTTGRRRSVGASGIA